MNRITKTDIAKLEKELKAEQAKDNSNIKRITFLKATINRYSKQIGKEEPYRW